MQAKVLSEWRSDLTLSLLLMPGCSSIDYKRTHDIMPLRPMLVAISVDGEVADVPVPQVGPKGYAEAVREFVWKRWTEAGQQLKVLIERNPTDWTCRYAFAVAQELSGDFSDAQKSYLEADRLVGGQDLYCQAGLRRVERHMESFRKP